MIRLSNGHSFDRMVASGALAFDCKGWLWERPLLWLGLIQPDLFTAVTKTLTLHKLKGNLKWWNPLSCLRLISGGSVNKIGLTNPGIKWWLRKIAPKIDFQKYPIVVSIYGTKEELVEMAEMLNHLDIVGIEINVSCPNTGHPLETAMVVVDCVRAVKCVSRHPIIIKVSVDQDYLTIARELVGIAEAISINSVPWEIVFSNKRSPLWRLKRKVGGGGGGVSGKPAQKHNWKAVKALAEQGLLPVIGPSVMKFEDIGKLVKLGAKAISFGAIHLRTPWKPTAFVRREQKANLNPRT